MENKDIPELAYNKKIIPFVNNQIRKLPILTTTPQFSNLQPAKTIGKDWNDVLVNSKKQENSTKRRYN